MSETSIVNAALPRTEADELMVTLTF